jgi:hypothetical protein
VNGLVLVEAERIAWLCRKVGRIKSFAWISKRVGDGFFSSVLDGLVQPEIHRVGTDLHGCREDGLSCLKGSSEEGMVHQGS